MSEKRVDESWKDKVETEKETVVKETVVNEDSSSAAQMEEFPEPTFSIFISSLAMQALIALGEIENPITNKKETEKEQAKYLIDTISMIQEKTKNNLTEEEAKVVDQVLYELRMKYVSISQ